MAIIGIKPKLMTPQFVDYITEIDANMNTNIKVPLFEGGAFIREDVGFVFISHLFPPVHYLAYIGIAFMLVFDYFRVWLMLLDLILFIPLLMNTSMFYRGVFWLGLKKKKIKIEGFI